MIDASVGFHCPECAKGGRQRVYTSRTLPGSGPPLVTYALIAVNVAVFLIGLGLGTSPTQSRGELAVDYGLIGHGVTVTGEVVGVADGEWYRIVTAGFLHAGLLHLAFNMYLLYLLGQLLEPAVGRMRFALIYFVSLLAGSLGVLLVSPDVLTVGASGAVFGLMGAAVVLQRSRGISPFASGLGGLIAINLVLTFLIPGISVGGHVGGLIGGLVAGALLLELPERVTLPRAVPELAALALGAAAVAGSLTVV
jgi:membrane associated rhomboid family serine protease